MSKQIDEQINAELKKFIDNLIKIKNKPVSNSLKLRMLIDALISYERRGEDKSVKCL